MNASSTWVTAAIAQWIRVHLSSWGSVFESRAQQQSFLQFIFELWCEKDKIISLGLFQELEVRNFNSSKRYALKHHTQADNHLKFARLSESDEIAILNFSRIHLLQSRTGLISIFFLCEHPETAKRRWLCTGVYLPRYVCALMSSTRDED